MATLMKKVGSELKVHMSEKHMCEEKGNCAIFLMKEDLLCIQMRPDVYKRQDYSTDKIYMK